MHRREFNTALLGLVGGAALRRAGPPRISDIRVNGGRLLANLRALSAIGETAAGAQRIAYSDADRSARAVAAELMRAAQLAAQAAAPTSSTLYSRREACWSMNEPVPAAQSPLEE